MLVCGIIILTVGILRMFQFCRQQNHRQNEIQAFNAGTVL